MKTLHLFDPEPDKPHSKSHFQSPCLAWAPGHESSRRNNMLDHFQVAVPVPMQNVINELRMHPYVCWDQHEIWGAGVPRSDRVIFNLLCANSPYRYLKRRKVLIPYYGGVGFQAHIKHCLYKTGNGLQCR